MKIMKFEPKNLENLGGALWPVGAYKFIVEDATETSNNYGDQLQLKLKVKNAEGQIKLMTTWLNAESAALGFFCQSVGLLDKYNTGEIIDGDCMRKVGFCELGHKDPDDKGNVYNKVAKYLTKSEFESYVTPAEPKIAPAKEEFEDSDIPF